MTIYIIEIVFIWIFNFLCFHTTIGRYQNKKKLFLFLSLTMMTLVLGLRSNGVGEDTQHYVDIFEKSVNLDWIRVFTKFRIVWRMVDGFPDTIENGFLLLTKSVRFFTDNPQVFLLVIAALTMGCFGRFIYDNSEDVFLSTYVLMCECIYMSAFNGARQILALSIGINAFTLLKRGKIKSAIGVMALAGLIHNSALIYLLAIPLMLVKGKKEAGTYKRFKYVFFVCALVPFLLPVVNLIFSHLFLRYSMYFENNYWSVQVGGTMLLWAFELLLILMLYRKRFHPEGSFELSALVLIYLMLEAIAFEHSAFSRVAWYYRGFLILFFPVAVKGIPREGNKRMMAFVLLVLLTLVFISYARVDTRTYSFLLR